MRKRRSYHHGNLREALLAASLVLMRRSGSAAFTLREVARHAGVSHNAPYRHFRSKEDLLAALAAEGFDRLTESMKTAADSASGALQRFRRSGRGYVDFALHYPQHFSIMFDIAWQFDSYPETRLAGERAFGALVGYIEACQADGVLPTGDARPFALLAWSMVHGVAKLAISGRLPLWGPAEILDFTDTATAALARGLPLAFTSKS